MIPGVVHFVFGLEEQREPFHFLHYVSVESCRRVLAPETIYFHHKHLPWGPWWERIRPHLTLVEVDLVDEVLAADYSAGHVPSAYRYAHHADFIRLDALIERGGIYADIDTIFLRRLPAELLDAPFVIGREPPVRDEQTGETRPSLSNALLMAEPNALFARAWRERMPDALNGTWSNHSGFLSHELSQRMPAVVHVEPEATFFPFPPSRIGLSRLLAEPHPIPPEAVSVHLWAHLWWDRRRRDFSEAHGGWCAPSVVRHARTTFAELARPYLPDRDERARAAPRSPVTRRIAPAPSPGTWSYLSLDEYSGYGVAADRCMAALEDSGLLVDWTPFVPGTGWGLSYEPVPSLDAFALPDAAHASRATSRAGCSRAPGRVVVAHLVAEYLPLVRERCPDAFLVGHTVWDTDRLPDHWIPCLDQVDLIVVPSRFSADAVAASPVAAPVAVVAHVAPQIISQESATWPGIPEDIFVFYTIGEWNERKAVFKTIEAYLQAFTGRDRVLLIVKTSPQDHRVAPSASRRAAGPGTSAWSLAQLLARHADPPAVKLVTRALTEDAVSALHRRGDCFVSLCRSEGWGLGAFDAAAYGNPVVTTGFGGHLDYLAGSPYLVGFDVVPVEDPVWFPSYAPDQRWAEPDVEHGAALLRGVAADPAQATTLASSIAAEIGRRYRPAAIASAFRAAVERHRSRRARPSPTSGADRHW